ncbi:MAG: hypothetical protein DRP68_04450 [Candidatus Omnitrophota bacterium]|nr:MAG: hypothetical protein DRP68_04450 [Candidatus Omnitrophota bacterium]RKY46343.1 MAG: hypothetical protein DRP81_00900 [Candidatus Omnitrophota bacterium]HDN85913.1 GGDEF domain-containing protein [Candidatus Omnitrophota bacterium]
MLYLLIVIFLLLGVISLKIRSIFSLRNHYKKKLASLKERAANLEETVDTFRSQLRKIEEAVSETFFIYELAGKLSSLLDREKVITTFEEELNLLPSIDEIVLSPQPKKGYLIFRLATQPPQFLNVKTNYPQVKENLRVIVKMINLCLERISLYEKLHNLSIHDTLTNIYNRRYFSFRFNEEFERAKKYKLTFSLLMIDIDHFKKINDNYGHLVGDVVLRGTVKLIKESIREVDFLARYGGEEFVVILPQTDREGAFLVGERIRKSIASASIKAFDEVLNITVSIGIANYPVNSVYPNLLIEVADKALYKAKQKGRNRVEYF